MLFLILNHIICFNILKVLSSLTLFIDLFIYKTWLWKCILDRFNITGIVFALISSLPARVLVWQCTLDMVTWTFEYMFTDHLTATNFINIIRVVFITKSHADLPFSVCFATLYLFIFYLQKLFLERYFSFCLLITIALHSLSFSCF